MATCRFRRNPLHQQHKFRPLHAAEPHSLTQKNARMEPSFLQTFVVDDISSILPVQDFHHLTRLPDKDIDIAVGRVESDHPDLSAQAVDTHAHIRRMLRHDNAVILIQIEHCVFAAKFASKNAIQKSAFFGRIHFGRHGSFGNDGNYGSYGNRRQFKEEKAYW